MKKWFVCMALLCALVLLVACGKEGAEDMKSEIGSDFQMTAVIQNIGQHVEVEVVESDYAFGVYWVITPEETKYLDKEGNSITREDLKQGDKVKISYGGQVMMSSPPQIVAASIQVIE